MAQGFNLTSDVAADGNPSGHIGGDLDVYSLATDNDTVVRDAIVLVVRTRRGEWYHNPALGLDPNVSDYVTTDAEIRAILESDTTDMLSDMIGFTLTSVEADRIDNSRNWLLSIVGKATRLLVISVSTEIAA